MSVIPTALLSFGMSGKVFHAPFIKAHPGFLLKGAWERSQKRVQEIYPEVHSYHSLDEILNDPAIELVIVNTPNYTHYEFARAALLAGKHVIVEKAFTTTVAEALALKALADKKQLVLSVFQNRRWDSDFSTVKKVTEDGLLGDIVEAELRFERYKPALSPKQHKETATPGAGLLNDLGPHLVDQALFLFGMPQALYAELRITRDGSQVDDWFDIVLHYDRCRVRLKSGFYYREPLPAFVLQGKLGSFIKSRADVQETLLTAGVQPTEGNWATEPEEEQGLLHTIIDGEVVRKKIATLPGNYYRYYEGIFKAIRSGAPVPVSAEEGVNVMRVLEAIRRSNDTKAVVYL